MRSSLVFGCLSLAVAAAASTGCASTLGSASGQERVVVAVDAPRASTSSEVVEVTEVVPPVAPEVAPARPRLTQTVTLGQGASEPVYTAAGQPQQANGMNGPNVVVNNNITVVGGQPAVYGGYGGYGYGYGYGYGGRPAGFQDYGRGGGSTSRGGGGAWAPSGWEGAGRTAAPGHTPGVGGNWAPAPSHGPRSMK
jgi:hypothetical protein